MTAYKTDEQQISFDDQTSEERIISADLGMLCLLNRRPHIRRYTWRSKVHRSRRDCGSDRFENTTVDPQTVLSEYMGNTFLARRLSDITTNKQTAKSQRMPALLGPFQRLRIHSQKRRTSSSPFGCFSGYRESLEQRQAMLLQRAG